MRNRIHMRADVYAFCHLIAEIRSFHSFFSSFMYRFTNRQGSLPIDTLRQIAASRAQRAHHPRPQAPQKNHFWRYVLSMICVIPMETGLPLNRVFLSCIVIATAGAANWERNARMSWSSCLLWYLYQLTSRYSRGMLDVHTLKATRRSVPSCSAPFVHSF